MKIADADESHCDAIAVIYNHAVARTTAIWNDTMVDADNRISWLTARREAGFPVIVALDREDAVLGYASFGDWRAFDGYRHTVEHSVYVHPDRAGAGIGTALMQALIQHAREAGKHVMVAGIEAGNENSIRLHEKLGFQRVGLLPQVGTKFGRWLDLCFMQLTLDDRPAPPDA